jgi:hypothetical protein
VPTAIRQGAQSALSQLTGNAGGAGSGQSQGGGGGSSDGGVGGTVITQTGTAIPQYDEFFFANVGWGHSTRPQSNPFTTGVTALTFDNTNYSFGFQKSFTPGTQVQFISSNSRVLSNSPRNDLNPFTNSNISLQITQPLLQGFGVAVNTRNIRVAKNNQKVNDWCSSSR